MDGFQVCASTNATCADSTHPSTPAEWIAFMRVGLARTLASPALAAVSTANAPAYGRKSPVSLATFDHSSSSWKTPQLCLFEGLGESLEIWPAWGMTRDGVCSELPRSVPRTYAPAGGGLRWPTLTTTDSKERAYHMVDGREVLSLVGVVRLLPTSLASDARSPGFSASRSAKNSRPLRERLKSTGGSLNPTWCEWFMGWPLGSTALRHWATGKSRSKRQRLGVCSADPTHYGHPAKGTGILRNPLYTGRLIWNRSYWTKDPNTGRRTRRERPQEQWIIRDVPELRIIPADLAARVAHRHRDIEEATRTARAVMRNQGSIGPRPRHLLSGLLVCGNCGAPFVTVNQARYGCSAARYRGAAVCDMRSTITRERLERRILDTVRGRLFSPAALAVYRAELIAETKRLAEAAKPDLGALRRTLADLDARIGNLIEMAATGVHSPALRAALEGTEAERQGVQQELERADRAALVVPLPTDIEGLFRDQIEHLERELAQDMDAARAILKDLIGQVRIVKNEKALVAELTGLYQGLYANDGSGGRI